ncbi:tRNA 2-thiouridine(34) synthase MnmA [Patescibacteria group bacterium]
MKVFTKKDKKVFVGMSGGVDSSVAATLLKKDGYDVTGVFIKTWQPDWLPCTWPEERRDAMRVAAHLNIPFLTFDLSKEYKKNVADYFITEYKKGRVPNPDVMCNKEIKFGAFLKKALEMGADYVATGHYTRLEKIENKYKLLRGIDDNKDQSYFLWTLNQKQLKNCLFPVGEYEKPEIRKFAEKFKLPTAQKKDSQGICFLGEVEMKDFLKHYIEEKPGDVLNERGEIIGTHDGAVFFTIGQRHGFNTRKEGDKSLPYYVVAKNIKKNTITVAHEYAEREYAKKEIFLENMNWISGKPKVGKEYDAQIRYRQQPEKCILTRNDEKTSIIFEHPQNVPSGQSLVLYEADVCIGGGIIA